MIARTYGVSRHLIRNTLRNIHNDDLDEDAICLRRYVGKYAGARGVIVQSSNDDNIDPPTQSAKADTSPSMVGRERITMECVEIVSLSLISYIAPSGHALSTDHT